MDSMSYSLSKGIIDKKFANFSNDFGKFFQQIINDPEVHMINRNRGSGTRVLLDRYLSDQQPSGFYQEAK